MDDGSKNDAAARAERARRLQAQIDKYVKPESVPAPPRDGTERRPRSPRDAIHDTMRGLDKERGGKR